MHMLILHVALPTSDISDLLIIICDAQPQWGYEVGRKGIKTNTSEQGRAYP